MTETSRPDTPARRLLKRMVLAVMVVAASLLLCEVTLRCLGIPGELEEEWLLLPDEVRGRVFDPQTLFANLEFLDENHYRTEEGKPTIVALGDSYTGGFHVARADNYLSVLRRQLHRDGIDATIIDMGVGYSGNDQHLAILKHKVLTRLQPDLVIWQLCYNDLWENIELSLYRVDDDSRLVHHGIERNWLYLREKLCRLLPGPLGLAKRAYLFRLLLDATKLYWASEVPPEYEDRLLDYGRLKAQLILEEVVRLSKEHGFKLVFALVDPQAIHLGPEDAASVDTSDWWHSNFVALKAMFSGREHFIDTQFSADDLAAVNRHFSSRITSVGRGLFLDGEHDPAPLGIRHYNKFGYWVFARKIARYLNANRERLFD